MGLLSLYTTTGSAQKIAAYQPEQMHADLEKFKTALIKVHPGTYTHQSPEEFEELIENLKFETSKPLEAKAFYRIVLRLIAGIHDGHTQAYTFGKLGNVINNQKRLPFKVYIRDERIFILKDMSSQKIPEGSEVIAIDGNLSNGILQEVLKHYSSDGKRHNGMYHWLGNPYRPFYRIYPEIYVARPSYDVAYRDYNTRKIVLAKVDAIPKDMYEKIDSVKYGHAKTAEENLMFDINKQKGYAYMKIGLFIKDGFDDPENIYPDFYKKCFKEISHGKIQNLIIDLRNNGGGKASNAAYLLQYFIDKPVKPAKEIITLGNDAHFLETTGDTLNLDNYFGLMQKNDGTFRVTKSEVLRDLMVYDPIKEYNYTGKLFVLINGGTTSAAGIAAGLLREYTNAVFIGEETYGYAGISNGVRQISIMGDHTETAIYLPLLHAEYAMDAHVQKRSVVPNYQVSNSVQDILNNTDAVLNFVLNNVLAAKK